MNNVRAIQKLNERELDLAVAGGRGSWHEDYKDSAYIFIGGLPRQLTEGDVITIFSQFGEVLDINLPRDKEAGERRGFGFLMYEDQRSTVLAVDNLNGAVVLGRTLRVDHTREYKQPKKRGSDGKMHDAEEQSLNAAPRPLSPGSGPIKGRTPEPEGDLEDPMLLFKSNLDSDEDERRRDGHRARKAERAKIRTERAERSDRHRSRSQRDDSSRHDRHDRGHHRSHSDHHSRHDHSSRDKKERRSRGGLDRDCHRSRYSSEHDSRASRPRPREDRFGQDARPHSDRCARPQSRSQSPRRSPFERR